VAWAVDNATEDWEDAVIHYLRTYEGRWRAWVTPDAYERSRPPWPPPMGWGARVLGTGDHMEGDAEARISSSPLPISLPSARTFLVAAAFGGAALAVVAAKLTLPIPGTGVVTDPCEIFATTGAGLTGLFGGVVIGLLAGIREPGGIVLASLLAHIAGGLWMGIAYKKLVFEHTEMPTRALGWAGLVALYYYLVVIPGFVIGIASFDPTVYVEYFGDDTPWVRAYLELGEGALPEATLTTLVTTLAYVALPRRHRWPLW